MSHYIIFISDQHLQQDQISEALTYDYLSTAHRKLCPTHVEETLINSSENICMNYGCYSKNNIIT